MFCYQNSIQFFVSIDVFSRVWVLFCPCSPNELQASATIQISATYSTKTTTHDPFLSYQEVRRCLTLFPSKLFVFLSRALFLQGRLSSGTASLSPASSQYWVEYWVQLPVTTVREVQERAPAHAWPISSLGNIHLPWGTCLPSTGSLMTPGSLILQLASTSQGFFTAVVLSLSNIWYGSQPRE